MLVQELQTPVSQLSGIGTNTAKALASLAIFNIGELLQHYPSRYLDRNLIVPLADFAKADECNCIVEVLAHETLVINDKRILKIWIKDTDTTAVLVCFGRSFLARQLLEGESYCLAGKFNLRFNELQASQFDFAPLAEQSRFQSIVAVYPLAAKLSQKLLHKIMQEALELFSFAVEDELPMKLIEAKDLLSKKEALQKIHFPKNIIDLDYARKSLVYEELFHLMLVVARRKHKRAGISPRKQGLSTGKNLMRQARARLSFKLSGAQERVIAEIINDLQQNKLMQRLLQGDVGCGKTLVALLTALYTIENGGQVAIMAPTEILSRQLLESVEFLYRDLHITYGYLSGQSKGQERKTKLAGFLDGSIQVAVGTHALFSKDISYKNLQYIIVDEQHRFGVAQRASLWHKGQNPDLLLMTATPIPRSLALSIYGDLDISIIDEVPLGRKAVITHLAKTANITKVYDFIHAELQEGHQIYFVYPLIDESSKSDLKNVETMYEHLKKNIFPKYELEVIHSKVAPQDKERIMQKFKQGETHILIATTVIEVGIDVANATCVVIEHAENFGLSQLHQLRGRVGRSELQSYCFLVYDETISSNSKQRLKILKDTNDGFKIAEEDFKLRGSGSITGVQQSGFLKLRIADTARDIHILQDAKQEASNLIIQDPGLLDPVNSPLRKLYQIQPPFDDEYLISG